MNSTATTRSALVLTLVFASSILAAQSPRPLRPDEYGRWEQLAAQRTPLSADGRWLVYGIVRANRQNELRVQAIDGGAPVILPFGEQPAFSDDSRWLAYLIGLSEEQEAKLRKDKKPVRKQLGLLELATGKSTVVDGVESFSLSPAGSHVAMRHYAPEAAAGTPVPAAGEESPKGQHPGDPGVGHGHSDHVRIGVGTRLAGQRHPPRLCRHRRRQRG